jgi:hypothetical protein
VDTLVSAATLLIPKYEKVVYETTIAPLVEPEETVPNTSHVAAPLVWRSRRVPPVTFAHHSWILDKVAK